ncbi:MAG: peptidylprolyl isomerase [Deltaproteobacteria bacterium]|nr:peptidylprolyl isomerase [Deltaproteobacteria bacterium]
MTGLRNDSRVLGCGSRVLASALFCLAAATAAADDLESPTDPLIAAIDAFIAELAVDKSDEDWKSKVPAPGAAAAFDPEKTYYWNLETNRGDLKIELFPKSAPLHVLSTIYLTRLGFYDDVKFHRIVTDFVVQGGDPTGSGKGGPAYRYGGEFDPELSHNKKGVVSMANSGPGTDGSQFFISLGPATRLNGKHTIFGKLADGKPALSKLGRAGTTRGKPKRKAYIKKATISVE